ncbi:MAG: hypothetical protein KJP25_11540 [Gammaproteobacteria bacterium]|nr:hypothetical protein [Gammaproteobacteria bacterium]NNM10861.1 folate-binding protein YgfZ [Pseudomonadales bacterium]RZV54852.1 MAG: folate-binding protein [Pseudomonadales bacterium]
MTDQPTSHLDAFWQRLYRKQSSLEQFGEHSFANTGITPDPDHHAWIAPLHQCGVVQVTGADSETFLQGQLTIDVAQLAERECGFAAHCDAKGRMHANFLLYRQSENRFWLQLPLSTAAIACQSLAKYAVFSKVEVSDISSEVFCIGFAPQDYIADLVREHDALARTDVLVWRHGLASLILPRSACEELLAWQKQTGIAWQGSARWQQLAIDAGIGFVEAETSGEFIPQMLNMDCLDGISFTKGCYTGQEIIARMKYRGNVKRRCFPFAAEFSDFEIGHELRTQATIDLASAVKPGASITGSEGKNCGLVVNAVTNSLGACRGLAVIKLDHKPAPVPESAKDGPELSLAGVDESRKNPVPLTLNRPPYAIPIN